MSKVCVCPGGARGGHVSITWSNNHAHACTKACALSEGLSACSVCTHVCLLLGTIINALYMSVGSLGVCFVCSPVGVCNLCWEW